MGWRYLAVPEQVEGECREKHFLKCRARETCSARKAFPLKSSPGDVHNTVRCWSISEGWPHGPKVSPSTVPTASSPSAISSQPFPVSVVIRTSVHRAHTSRFCCLGSCLSILTSGPKEKWSCPLTKENNLLLVLALVYTAVLKLWCAQASVEEPVDTHVPRNGHRNTSQR